MIKIMRYGEVPNSEIFARPDESIDVSGTVSDILQDVKKGETMQFWTIAKGLTESPRIILTWRLPRKKSKKLFSGQAPALLRFCRELQKT